VSSRYSIESSAIARATTRSDTPFARPRDARVMRHRHLLDAEARASARARGSRC
jgi:hypothetical protein